MKITIFAIGKHMPHWVNEAYQEYSKRLPPDFALDLIEINTTARTKNADIKKIQEKEATDLLAAIPPRHYIIALDQNGQSWNTLQLSAQLQHWREEHPHIALLIGGPEGFSPTILNRAHLKWSLSPLTLPHPLVRVIAAEQLFRAWSILAGHPYHR